MQKLYINRYLAFILALVLTLVFHPFCTKRTTKITNIDKGIKVVIAKQLDSSMIDFAVEEIEKSLEDVGYTVNVSPITKMSNYDKGNMILIGIPEEVSPLKEIIDGKEINHSKVEVDGFIINVQDTEDKGKVIIITGVDHRGVMYGGLELAEKIILQGGIDRLGNFSRNPFLTVRGFHYNLPLQSTRAEEYTDPVQRENPEWFFDLDGYWKKFFDKLAKDRYNALLMWDPHPFDRMVRIEKYPEATSLTEEEYEEKYRFWSRFFKMAKERGIDTYLITWNIHISKSFAEAHGFSLTGQDDPMIRDYMRESVSALLKTYPDLTGIGSTVGDSRFGRGVKPEEKVLWLKDTYIAGIKKSGRIIPFILRYWGTRPDIAQNIIASDYPGEVFVTIKFNGEHLYSLPTPHFYQEEWLTQDPKDYTVLWHLWNSSMYIMRWGDPDFVKEAIVSCSGDYSAGHVYGTEFKIPGEDRIHTDATKGHKDWDYEWERRWFTITLWGRLGYDPDIPEDFWIQHFAHKFGDKAGENIFMATKYSSKILPTVNVFHWNYMDYDVWVEGCVGLTTYKTMSFNGRVPDQFHDVHEFIYNNTMDDKYLNILEFVNSVLKGDKIDEKLITPLEVADELDGYADKELEYANKADKEVNRSKNEWECTLMDLKALAYLGHYYAEKIRGATDLMFAYETNDKKYQESAVKHLENALSWWKKLVDVNDKHWKPHLIISHSRLTKFYWGLYLPNVEEDIKIARELRPIPEKLKFK